MKIIKSFLLVSVSLCATNLLYAQEPKAEVGKPIEPKTTSTDNRPSPTPVLKPQNGVIPATAAEAPAVLQKEEPGKKQNEALKLVVITPDDNSATKTLTAEQLKTLNGKTEKPKQVGQSPAVVKPPKQ